MKRGKTNPFGQFRRPLSAQEFSDLFDRPGGIPVLKQFFGSSNSTAGFVKENFAQLELEVHQAVTIGCAAQASKEPDLRALKEQCPHLAAAASDSELRGILSNGKQNPKDVAASILARLLQRSESSIKKWAQNKK